LRGPSANLKMWWLLFSIVLGFGIVKEQQFIFIYYTIWSFTLEIVYFGLLLFGQKTRGLYSIILAPSIVICAGFWIVIAPMVQWSRPNVNILMTLVTHGCNMVALLAQKQERIYMHEFWKPALFTTIYNIFLALYVGSGGRSVSGQLPYWYAQYDRPIGWVFALLAIFANVIVHMGVSAYMYPKDKEHPTPHTV